MTQDTYSQGTFLEVEKPRAYTGTTGLMTYAIFLPKVLSKAPQDYGSLAKRGSVQASSPSHAVSQYMHRASTNRVLMQPRLVLDALVREHGSLDRFACVVPRVEVAGRHWKSCTPEERANYRDLAFIAEYAATRGRDPSDVRDEARAILARVDASRAWWLAQKGSA